MGTGHFHHMTKTCLRMDSRKSKQSRKRWREIASWWPHLSTQIKAKMKTSSPYIGESLPLSMLFWINNKKLSLNNRKSPNIECRDKCMNIDIYSLTNYVPNAHYAQSLTARPVHQWGKCSGKDPEGGVPARWQRGQLFREHDMCWMALCVKEAYSFHYSANSSQYPLCILGTEWQWKATWDITHSPMDLSVS